MHYRCATDVIPKCRRSRGYVTNLYKYGPLLENLTIPAVDAELTTVTTVTTTTTTTTFRPCHPSRRDVLRHLLRRRRSRLPTLPRADEVVARRLHQHPKPLVPWLTLLLMNLPQDRLVLLMTPPVNLLLSPGPPGPPQWPPKLQRAPTQQWPPTPPQ